MKKIASTLFLSICMIMLTLAQSTVNPPVPPEPPATPVSPAAKSNKMERLKNIPPENKAKIITEQIHKVVMLTPEQYDQVYQIELDFAQKVAQLPEPQKGAMSDDLKNLRMERKTAIKAVLTQEQLVKLNQWVKAKKDELKAKQGNHPGMPTPPVLDEY